MLYTFWIQPRVGPMIRWTGLTKRQAIAMNNNTSNFIAYEDAEVISWGWNEEKP